jgi:hypothetical protein
VLIIADDGTLVPPICQACITQGLSWNIVQCSAFERSEVAEIVKALAKETGVEFEQRIIDEMLQLYEQTKTAMPEQRFTLAHVQTVFHILTATRTYDYDSYHRAFEDNRQALHQAINVCDIISFVEDFSWTDAVWFRNMIKVPLRESKDRIAGFIKQHYEELVPQPGARKRWPSPDDAPVAAGR